MGWGLMGVHEARLAYQELVDEGCAEELEEDAVVRGD